MEGAVNITPYNQTAEQSVIGSMLLDRDCIGTVTQLVRADDFTTRETKNILNV